MNEKIGLAEHNISRLSPREANDAGNRFYVHGGSNLMPTGDLFALDLCEWRWTEILVDEAAPLQRYSHQLSISDDNHLFLYGGVDELGASCQNLYTADLSGTDKAESSCRSLVALDSSSFLKVERDIIKYKDFN